MDKHQRDVYHFHLACGLRAPDSPQLPPFDDISLRLNLIQEEFDELREALLKGDLVETIDALCDLDYVVQGCAVALGIDLEEFWDIVHHSNMRKASGPKREDGKQLKPEGWEPPTLAIRDRIKSRGFHVVWMQ